MCHTTEGGDEGMKYIFENLQFSIFKMFSKIAFETEQVQAGWILWISGNCSCVEC